MQEIYSIYNGGVISDTYVSPAVPESAKNSTTVDANVFTRLLKNRIIFVNTKIDDDMASTIQAQLLWLDAQNHKDITMYVNTPGGLVSAGMLIYDTMKIISSKVITVCTGTAASMGSILLSGGDKRAALPSSRVLIHQPLGGAQGQAADILIAAKEIEKCRDRLCKVLSQNCKKDYDEVFKDIDRDYWMSAEEALEYGIIDEIIGYSDKSKVKDDKK